MPTPAIALADFIHDPAAVRLLAADLAARTGMHVSLVEVPDDVSAPSPAQLQAMLSSETPHVICMCSPSYMRNEDQLCVVAMPVLEPTLVDCGGEPVYSSRLVVPVGSAARGFDDLRGTVVAFNDEESLSGYHQLRFILEAHGQDGTFFAKAVRSGGHARSLCMLTAGTADVACVDVSVIHRLRSTGEFEAEFTALDVAVPDMPIQPFVMSKAVPAALRERLTAGFMGLHESAESDSKTNEVSALTAMMVSHFVYRDGSFFEQAK